MVQKSSSRGIKRTFNPERSHGQDENVFTFGSNSKPTKRQKCRTKNVHPEKNLQKKTTSSKISCISLENVESYLECPVCLIVPKVGPIYQCRNGHLLCNECHPKLQRCPLCQIPLEKLRNLLSEQLVSIIYPEYQFSIDRTTRTREFLWQGQLYWRENLRPPSGANNLQQLVNQRIERNIHLNITTAIENGAPEVTAINWPPTLIMQTIPIALINRTGKEFFSNSRTVLFHPSEEESLKSLTTLFGGNGGNTGLAGCVHFSGAQNCDIKVLILLYSAGKKVFLGFIPNDQTNFVERIREEIRKEKSKRDAILATQVTHHVITNNNNNNNPDIPFSNRNDLL